MRRLLVGVALLAVLAMPLSPGVVQAGAGEPTTNLAAVACPAVNTCVAVGQGSNVLAPLVEISSGSIWTAESVPTLGNADANVAFLGVACSASTACTAVGQYLAKSGDEVTLAERWNGSSWMVQSMPALPAGSDPVEVSSVSCPSATACTAVGDYLDEYTGVWHTLAERWNGSMWKIQTAPTLSGITIVHFEGVACPSTSVCTAVGTYIQPSGEQLPLVERWNGAQWSIQNTPALPPGSSAIFYGVACPSTSLCEAVGTNFLSSGSVGLAEVWNGLQWGLQATPKGIDELSGVACSSPNACSAVGGGATVAPMVEHRTSGEWTTQSVPSPKEATSSSLDGVSCPSASVCVAVGDWIAPNIPGESTLEDRWVNNKWSIDGSTYGPAILAAAIDEAGQPYCFDGGNKNGPTHGDGNTDGATQCGKTSIVGFDCTGLTLYAVYRATGILLPHGLGQQAGGTLINTPSIAQLEVGDLLLFGPSVSDYVHTGIYEGIVNGSPEMWDANIAGSPYPDGVQQRSVTWETSGAQGNPLVGAVRF